MGHHSKNRIYIIGAGLAGISITREIQSKGILGRVVSFLDDDPDKIGKKIFGIPVLGPVESVINLINTTPEDEAIIAIPSATRDEIRCIYGLLKKADFARIRIIPSVSEILEYEAHLIQTREINPEDLLSRTPLKISLRESLPFVRDKRVLITGAGGSIGSELSRQLLFGGVQRLYLFGHGENSIFDIDRELRLLQEEGVGFKTAVVPVIGELQDHEYMIHILKRLKADIIFHTAAHKHVPMLEANPVAAIKNNVFGTLNLIKASNIADVSRFIMISTDKAVEPVSIYGISKYLAEELVIRENKAGKNYMVVRFGNVLGSRGSILPLFKKQISKGGPITITDNNARRFFMTIPEAVSLIIKAASTELKGDLYLLDMGEAVLIRDLAEQMIRFYGYEPGRDIKIIETGLRPGEKLSEKLVSANEYVEATSYPGILSLGKKTTITERLGPLLERLESVCYLNNHNSNYYRNRRVLKEILMEVAPGMEMDKNEPEY
jgi:FlaA1/EpsC-like NDP-sugar epimerase